MIRQILRRSAYVAQGAPRLGRRCTPTLSSSSSSSSLVWANTTTIPPCQTEQDVALQLKTLPLASYGNQRMMSTEQNADVRSGVTLDFRSGEIRFVNRDDAARWEAAASHFWNQSMWTTGLAKLHKVNLYQTGDKFCAHTDTPRDELIGTVLCCVYSTAAQPVFQCAEPSTKPAADSDWTWTWTDEHKDTSNWCCFYSDVPHHVRPVQGTRVVLSFQVFYDPLMDTMSTCSGCERKEWKWNASVEHRILHRCAQLVQKRMPARLGMSLDHQYPSASHIRAKGNDLLLQRLFRHYNPIELVPVVIVDDYKVNRYGEDDSSRGSSEVYWCTFDTDRDSLRRHAPRTLVSPRGSIPFLGRADHPHVVVNDYQSASEFVGNECQPESKHGIYVCAALVVFGE